MQYFIAILIFVVAYVLVKFLLDKVPTLTPIADVLAILAGALGALLYLGVIR